MSLEGDIHNFWLTLGSLKISPIEQVEFLAKLWTHQLPVSVQATAQVREILKSGTIHGANVFGKTGSGCVDCDSPTAKHSGWFSGVVETDRGIYSFALQYTNLLPSKSWAGPNAKKIFYRYLENNVDNIFSHE